MDEPRLYVRDGASVQQIPLGEVLEMSRAARELAAAALSGAPSAKETVEAVIHAATVYGPQRGRASVSAFLLRDAMAEIEQKKQAGAIVAAAENVGAPAAAEPATSSSGAGAPAAPPAAGPCNHPPDIACPSCAQAHLEARNAKKRAAGARV